MPVCYVGTSGYVYNHWLDKFYPRDVPKTGWLGYYGERFGTVELNNSFYRLPSEENFANWRDKVPGGFLYSVKVSRFITHMKKLRDVEGPLQTFISRARILREKLGPLLYQLPPNLHRNEELLECFLAILPQDLRHVFEFRHESWFTDTVFDLLRRYHAGFCIMDIVDTDCPRPVTAEFTYLRFHGTKAYYAGSYSDEQLKGWADWINGQGAEVNTAYAYFNNDMEANAVSNAMTLRRSLGENR